MKTSSTLRVRYSEIDRMGFAYHAHYLVWCEVARTDFIRSFGRSYSELEQAGLMLAVIDLQIRYERSARYDDTIRVDCALDRVQSRSITFSYEIFRAEPGPPERLATAITRLIALDAQGAPRALPGDLLEAFRNAFAASL